MKMSRNVPLNALRVFEAAARHGSFTRAGDELGMTQTAVSYQIKLLEETLGVTLFLRQPRQVVLSEAGERLRPKVAEGLGKLAEAIADLKGASEEKLHINSTPTFATQWLSRTLGDFQLKHPAIAVRLSTSQDLIDFSREEADVSIRWGKGDWPGLACHRVMRMDFAPMLSPKLAETIGGIRAPADLLKLPIISPLDIWWRTWFAAAGIDDPGLERFPANELGVQTIDAQVAMAGQGVAILNPGHFRAEVAAGQLYQPFELTCNDGRDYWLAYPENRRNIRKIKAFHDWILTALPKAV
ncbi:LysR substrate-binding domain-containing protein [Shinella sp. H4-D48]|uniref:LysR substrate-binding domain-containing protein n=1 Tax=Shinella sp. H4-D48 TaxID=2925841 RepID=UPI001F52D5AE|nr:LysR substrate-binding domain-containing protein [Shinella sp. H4-D48]UNK38971.1 LysR substrate-binding domain-containing protein [Shinella sp. H4-D48]